MIADPVGQRGRHCCWTPFKSGKEQPIQSQRIMSWKLMTAQFRRDRGDICNLVAKKELKRKRQWWGRQQTALQCSTELGKGLELQIKETAYFCSISIFSISVLCVCGGGEMKRVSQQYQVLLLLPLLWKNNKTPYDEGHRPKRVIVCLPTCHKNMNFSNTTLPTAIILLNLGCPPPPQKGGTSVYNGLGNKNPIRDYQIPWENKYYFNIKQIFKFLAPTMYLIFSSV